MGNVQHAPVLLRAAEVRRTPDALELVAKRRHESRGAGPWLAFNVFNATCALLLESLSTSTWLVAAGLCAFLAAHPPGTTTTTTEREDAPLVLRLLAFPAVDLALQLGEAALVLVAKWLFVGAYRRADHAFYGPYHYAWAVMLLLHRSTKPLFDKIRGTCFLNGWYRAFGATVGRDACLLASTVEFDLVQIGDRAAVGASVVLQPHTVEYMVIKLGPFALGTDAAVRHMAAIMPDTAVEDDAELLENSLLPKGCVVAAGTAWAGLPASEIDDPPDDDVVDDDDGPVGAQRAFSSRSKTIPIGPLPGAARSHSAYSPLVV